MRWRREENECSTIKQTEACSERRDPAVELQTPADRAEQRRLSETLQRPDGARGPALQTGERASVNALQTRAETWRSGSAALLITTESSVIQDQDII